MNKQLKSLTYKYFWQQKFKEVGLFFGIPTLSIGVLYLLSYFGRWFDLASFGGKGRILIMEANKTFWEHIRYGVFGLVVILILLAILFVMIDVFVNWICSNWEKAKQRAKMELVRSKKK